MLFDDSYGIEETGRAQRGKKRAGGMFFRSGEIPFASDCGPWAVCGSKSSTLQAIYTVGDSPGFRTHPIKDVEKSQLLSFACGLIKVNTTLWGGVSVLLLPKLWQRLKKKIIYDCEML